MNPARILLEHALNFPRERIPAAAFERAKFFLHDTLSVGAAGANAAYSEAILSVVRTWGEPGGARGALVLGRPGLRLPPASAAFLNAFQIHAQEYDCVHEAAVLHPMATLVGAVMAESTRTPALTGTQALEAVILGADVSLGLGVAAKSPLKFFRPATSGLFGAIAALCRLRNFGLDAALNAFGYGLSFASGTMQAHEEGKPALPVQIANAARAAVTAVDLAEAGLPGPHHSIDGVFGYMTLFETRFDLGPMLAGLGETFRITEVSSKPFPTGRAAHGAIGAVQLLRARHGLTAENLDRFTYRAPPLIHRLVGRPMVRAMGPAYARLCFPFLGAVTLTAGGVRLGDFTEARLNDERLKVLADKIFVEADDNPNPAAFVPALARARFKDGRKVDLDITTQLGSPEAPLSREQHLEKVRACLAFAGLEAMHDRLAAAIDGLESHETVAAVFALACGEAEA